MSCTSSLIGHDALRSGYDSDTEALEDLGKLVCSGVNTEAGLRDTAKTLDGLLLAGEILEGDADDALGAVVDNLEALDLAFIEKDLSNCLLHLRCGDIDSFMLRYTGVADAGQHICNGVCDLHNFFSFFRSYRGLALGFGDEVPH